SLTPALLDEPEDAPGSETAFGLLRIIKGVDRGQPVIEHIDQRSGDELSAVVAKFGDRGLYGGILDHPPIVAIVHRYHVAIAVSRALVGGEHRELLYRSAGSQQATGNVTVGIADAPRRAGMAEAIDRDPDRDAGGAAATSRPVGKTVTASEPGA